jgi:hypothetical protein
MGESTPIAYDMRRRGSEDGLDWTPIERLRDWLAGPARDVHELDEVVLGSLRELYRRWSAAPDPAERSRNPMDTATCDELDLWDGSLRLCLEAYAGAFRDFGRCVRNITPADVVGLCEVRSGLELLLAGRGDRTFDELVAAREALDEVFAEVIGPRLTASAELVPPEQRPTGGLTDFERWERYEKVPADETRPVPPGHGWWALVPTGTLVHAPDYGGLEHVPHKDWSKIW